MTGKRHYNVPVAKAFSSYSRRLLNQFSIDAEGDIQDIPNLGGLSEWD